MKISKIKQNLFYIFAVGISIFFLFFVVTCSWIGYDVKNQCQEAKKEYSGDCVESLTALLNDSNKSFKARNSAIWALGQIGDTRALPVLESYYTGNIPPKESLNGGISQYELKKAIKLADGGVNLSAIVWRTGTSWK